MRVLFLVLFSLVAAVSCNKNTETSQSAKHYQLTGRIVALNSHDRTATVDAAAVPGWMEAMTMEYPVKSRQEFDRLRVGERIKATLNVRDDSTYDLSGIQEERGK